MRSAKYVLGQEIVTVSTSDHERALKCSGALSMTVGDANLVDAALDPPPAQCTRRKRLAYSMAADAIAALRNKAGSHHPCIAKNPDDDRVDGKAGFHPALMKVQ